MQSAAEGWNTAGSRPVSGNADHVNPGAWQTATEGRNTDQLVSDQAVWPVDRVAAAIATPSVGLADLETLVQKLLLSIPAPAPPSLPVPVDIEIMLKHLLLLAPVLVLASPPRCATTVMGTVQRHLLQSGTPTSVPRSSLISTHRDWTTMVCFSCDRPGHGVSSCPHLDETFPYMLPGWSAEKMEAEQLQSGNDDWSGGGRVGGGQPPGSVIHFDPQTLVVVDGPPSPARGCRHGTCPQWALKTTFGLLMNKHIHP